tara:strand:+ start:3701 stop:3829 length:129 start_codon:yes stop_codon:yes gene_type:complete
MSIIICDKCDKRVDTDYEIIDDTEDYKLICINCKEKEEEKWK